MSQVKRVFQHDSKPVSNGTVLTFNIPSFDVIDDIILEFTNSGAAATKANILSSIGKVALSINGEQIVNCELSHIYSVYEALGVEVSQNLANVIGLNIGRYLFKDPFTEDFFCYGLPMSQTCQFRPFAANSSRISVLISKSSIIRRIWPALV